MNIIVIYMYNALGQGQTYFWGPNSFQNLKSPVQVVSEKMMFKYYGHVHVYVYSPVAGSDNPMGTKSFSES